jgi:hypothetical protein
MGIRCKRHRDTSINFTASPDACKKQFLIQLAFRQQSLSPPSKACELHASLIDLKAVQNAIALQIGRMA